MSSIFQKCLSFVFLFSYSPFSRIVHWLNCPSSFWLGSLPAASDLCPYPYCNFCLFWLTPSYAGVSRSSVCGEAASQQKWLSRNWKRRKHPSVCPKLHPFFLPFLQAFVHRIVSNRWEGKQQVWKRTLELNAQAFAAGPVNLNRSIPRFFLSV